MPASHFLEWRNGAVRVEPYWLPQFSEAGIDPAATGREMLDLIETAVRRETTATTGATVGAFLSGGIDSSTLAGMLARTTEPANTYSIGFAVPGYDEMEYARTCLLYTSRCV